MALPERVVKGAARAAEIMKQAADAKVTKGVEKVAPVSPAPAPAPAPKAAPQPTVESLQKELEAKNAEIERMAQVEARAKADQADASRRREEAERTAREAKKKAAEAEAALKLKIETGKVESLSQEERTLLGEDMVKAAVKIAREVSTDVVTQALKPVSDKVNEYARMSEQAYDSFLDLELPNFEQDNRDPNFLAWLGGVDPATQRVRKHLLENAHANMMGHRVVEIFHAFKEKREIGARTAAKPAADPLATRVEPAREETGPAPVVLTEGGGKIWKRWEISQFYRDKREGKFKGKEDEARKLETDIFRAQVEGRVS